MAFLARLAAFGNGVGAAVVEVEPAASDCLTTDGFRRQRGGLDVARPLVAGVVHIGVDVPLRLHAVDRATGAPSVRLPLSSVEPVYGLNPRVLVANHYPERGRPAPQPQRRRSALPLEHISLPVRLPGQHLHPQLGCSSWDSPSGQGGSNT